MGLSFRPGQWEGTYSARRISSSRDCPRDLDVLSQVLAHGLMETSKFWLRETSSTRQTNVLSWMSRAPSSYIDP